MLDGDRLVLGAFVLSAILAGGNAVGIRFSNMELQPYWGATLRFSLAAGMMWIVYFVMRRGMPDRRAVFGAALYGVFNFGGAFAFAFYALVELEAGFGQVLLAIVPLLTVILAALHGQERIRLEAAIGSILALTGIILMAGLSFEGSLLSILAGLASAACFAEATVLVRRFPGIGPLTLNTVGLTAGAIVLFLITLIAGNEIVLPDLTQTWLAVGYMVIIGTGIVFSLYVFVLQYWTASRGAYSFVLIPPFTALFGAWLLDEDIGIGFAIGAFLVLAGVYFGALRDRSIVARQPIEA